MPTDQEIAHKHARALLDRIEQARAIHLSDVSDEIAQAIKEAKTPPNPYAGAYLVDGVGIDVRAEVEAEIASMVPNPCFIAAGDRRERRYARSRQPITP